MKIIAIIPAAGKGSRFGMPKVDAHYNGITFSQRIISTLSETGITDYVLVRDVETPDMLASIRLGMEQAIAAHTRPDGWLIWPVDHPVVKPNTIHILTSVFMQKSNSVIIPRCQNQNGHPVLIPGAIAIHDSPEPLGLKGIIMQSGFPVEYINVDDVGILFNLNTPEDVMYV